MHILLIGNRGQLGWELERTLAPLGKVLSIDYPELDLSEPEAVRSVISSVRPDVLINASAYTAVDRAETEIDTAMAVNVRAPEIMAEEAKKLSALFIHYSTDYVFDGTKNELYVEKDTPNPINVYGRSKLMGEKAIEAVEGFYLIFRTSWVYSLRRNSFVTKVLQWSRTNQTLKIVNDQVSNPTWSRMLAEVNAYLLIKGGDQPIAWLHDRVGLYHLAGAGFVSRFEWAQAVLKLDPCPSEQVTREIVSARTDDFPTPAKRPLHTALDCSRFKETFGLQLPDWLTALQLAMENVR
ncbi:MAG: dTDP-4-dehydrorhamnose reductase [Anaerolineales bacterium]|nr:dTDP-4-dehydrorhamnose reductase [Anaerolineales bacterium]